MKLDYKPNVGGRGGSSMRVCLKGMGKKTKSRVANQQVHHIYRKIWAIWRKTNRVNQTETDLLGSYASCRFVWRRGLPRIANLKAKMLFSSQLFNLGYHIFRQTMYGRHARNYMYLYRIFL
jgi:hypothetical protein